MKHLTLVMAVLLLLLFASNNYCRSEEHPKGVTEQAVEEGKEEAKEALATEAQAKESTEKTKVKCDKAGEAAKEEVK